ncbi:hypothetical protein FC44_GL000633 [Lactobacillus intestinalis DSM 6629]|uniref:Surface layer protein A domain-containing protein n=2 Tax=Lactobacillus intestinalis TaxID=151781 RepID=A0ABR5PR48_9LACO|nr:hypothetical protein FC44_GL000633 [Lactobacillus intestinalis DSM 6629]
MLKDFGGYNYMKKRLAVMAASALLAVAPIATVTTSIATTQTVSAAEMSSKDLMKDYYDSSDTENEFYTLIKLTKKTPYLTAYPGETVASLSKKRVKDVTSNYGHVSKLTSMSVYNADDEGRPDFGQVLKWKQSLKSGHSYVAALRFTLGGIPRKGNYIYVSQNPYLPESELITDAFASAQEGADDVILLVPVHVTETKPASASFSAKGYVNTIKRNSRVRTYTSTGRFSKHYIYGHHTYRLNQKKNINGLGLCYKIYGKNQWIPAGKLSLR